MAKTKFNDSWYVRKDRINLFIPFEKDYSIEINKIGGGSVKGTTTNRFSNTDDEYYGLNFSVTSNDIVTFDTSLTSMFNQAFYGRKQVTTLAFWTKNVDANHHGNSGNVNGIRNNAVLADSWTEGYVFYPAGHTVTVPTATETGHRLDLNGMYKKTSTYITELVDNGTDDYTQSTNRWALNVFIIEHGEATNGPTTKCTIHTLYNDSNGNFNHYWATAENMDSSVVGTRTNNVSNMWSIGGCRNGVDANNMITYGYFYEGKLRNLMLYNIALSFDEINSLFDHGVDPYEATGLGNTDVDSFDSNFWGKYGVIAENSNVKFEKCLIGDVQNEFSNMSIKSNFSTTIANINQNTGRFDVAGRDASHLEVINRNNTVLDSGGTPEHYNDYTVDNPTTNEQTHKYGYESANTSLLSVGVWRNSFATGNGKIRFVKQKSSGHEIVSKAIGGSFIEGGTDLTRIDPSINPEILPSGRYITEWTVNKPNNTNYPDFLPKDYLRDRLGRSYKGYDFKTSISKTVNSGSAASNTSPSEGKYINNAFWGNTARYEKVLWTRPRDFTSNSITDDYFLSIEESKRIDLCSAWEPVFWMKAVYEVNNEPTISSRGYFSTIRLVLINEDMTKSAVYYKLGKPLSNSNNTNIRIAYGDWQFDSFNSINNNKDKERLARIYLPHAVIPVLRIPIPSVSTSHTANDAYNTSFANSDIVMVKAGQGRYQPDRGISYSPIFDGSSFKTTNVAMAYTSISPTDGSGSPNGTPSYRTFNSPGDAWPRYYAASNDGWYEFTWHFSYCIRDYNDTVKGIVEIKKNGSGGWVGGNNTNGGVAIGFVGDYVSGSKGRGYGADTLKAFVFMNKGDVAKISGYYGNNNVGGVTWFTIRKMSSNAISTVSTSNIINNVISNINDTGGKIKGSDQTGKYIEYVNVPVKYTKTVDSVTAEKSYQE